MLRKYFILFLISVWFVPSFASVTSPAPADKIFLNGTVYTAAEGKPKAEAVAVRNGRVIFVGSNADAKKLKGPRTTVVDLAGRFLYPGFTDAHCHIFGIGQRELTLNLEGTKTLDEFLARVKARVAQAKPGEWVVGRGWIETFWTPPVFPTRQDLDKVAPNNPVCLQRADGHALVVNSAALKIVGVDKSTPNPFGGEILRDKTTGEPTGMFIDQAQGRVGMFLPRPTDEDGAKALEVGAKRELSLGWVQVQNAGCSIPEIELIQKLYREGKLKIRIYNAVSGPGPAADRLLKGGTVIGGEGGRFTMRTIKLYMDGALGSRGAALLEPYADQTDSKGLFVLKPEEIQAVCVAALKAGVQIETHAIGDRANRQVLDIYEQAFAAVPPAQRKVKEPRWRIEHAQVIAPADLPRFAKLGVIPSMQPSHAIGDLHFALRRLGVERLAGAYAWKTLLESGAKICAGSDAPVERGEPMIEFYAAVARKDLNGFSGEGWHPEQAVSRAEALKMLTLYPAFAAFEEKERGTIEVGKLADFTILTADIMTIAEAEIPKTTCAMTVIGGEIVFSVY